MGLSAETGPFYLCIMNKNEKKFEQILKKV